MQVNANANPPVCSVANVNANTGFLDRNKMKLQFCLCNSNTYRT